MNATGAARRATISTSAIALAIATTVVVAGIVTMIAVALMISVSKARTVRYIWDTHSSTGVSVPLSSTTDGLIALTLTRG